MLIQLSEEQLNLLQKAKRRLMAMIIFSTAFCVTFLTQFEFLIYDFILCMVKGNLTVTVVMLIMNTIGIFAFMALMIVYIILFYKEIHEEPWKQVVKQYADFESETIIECDEPEPVVNMARQIIGVTYRKEYKSEYGTLPSYRESETIRGFKRVYYCNKFIRLAFEDQHMRVKRYYWLLLLVGGVIALKGLIFLAMVAVAMIM